MSSTRTLVMLFLVTFAEPVVAQHSEWKHSGSMFILTTPAGADLPASAAVENFPLLVRLHKDFFDFTQARPNGEDLRFSSAKGEPLPYQIDEWDAARGVAAIWVRVPKIAGNSRQELKLHWGKADAKSQSDGKAVFNESNGYLSVWHMSGPVTDETGTLTSKDTGTTPVPGVIGAARHFPGQKGIFGGDKIPNFPTGASPHTTEAWFRADQPNGNVIAWGNEHGQGKVVMQYSSPPHINMDCYFSGGNVASKSLMPPSEWAHVVHTYEKGDARLYVNGVLDGVNKSPGTPLAIKSPARLWIGGWYNNYSFVGDIDEVRISKVARSADWIKLQYENQKPHKTLVGHLVQPGNEFGLSHTEASIPEGKNMTFTAKAGGADKVSWIVVRDGKETVVAVNRLSFTLDAGRVVGDQSVLLRLKAIYPSETKTKDVRVTIKEEIPEPIFTLEALTAWDGRKTIEIVPRVANLEAIRAKGAGQLNIKWSLADLATIKDVMPGKLILKRCQNSGLLTVTASIDNGGKPTVQSVTIQVKEPAKDAWVERPIEKNEKPVDGQFYARDDKNEGTLLCNGVLEGAADSVFLRVFADDRPFSSTSRKPGPDGSYTFAVRLKPGLIKYRVEFGSKSGDTETILHKAGDLMCGDAYLINGQSNAVATDFGKDEPALCGQLDSRRRQAAGAAPHHQRRAHRGAAQFQAEHESGPRRAILPIGSGRTQDTDRVAAGLE